VHRVVLSELLHRRSRTLALLAGILVATAAFTVLTATSRTQRLEVRGTVAKSFRGDYDVLVRPRGSRNAFERRTAQVQPNFLSGVFGGISLRQWRRIERLPGVEVAAPIANVGYLLPTAKVRIGVDEAAGPRGRVLLRARVAWTSDRGMTRVPDSSQYAYVTDNRLRRPPGYANPEGPVGNIYRRWALRENVPGRSRPVAVCNELGSGDALAVLEGPWETIYRSQFGCFSREGRGYWNIGGPRLRRTRPFVLVRWAFPLLLTAIDPVAEARLTGLDRAVVDGRYLTPRDRSQVRRARSYGYTFRQRYLPVLAASRTFVDEKAEVAVERLGERAAARWLRPFPMYEGGDYFHDLRFLVRQPHGPVVQRAEVSSATAYRRLLRQLRGDDWEVSTLTTIWRIGQTVRGVRGPVSRHVDDFVWQNNSAGPLSWAYAPPTGRDTRFRDMTRTGAYTDELTKPRDQTPLLRAVGTFDPAALGTTPVRGAAPLSTLQPPQLTRPEGGKPLLPNGNLGGYLAQPPALLTTMQAARAFGPPLFKALDPDTAISAVRVRVAGVTGIDDLSRERIRQAAERIAAATGLDVDITAGASGAPTAIELPAGRYGRPKLAVSELWVRKGVAARVLSEIDRKSVVLFALILVVCALFVTNAAGAAVRARRSELGVLASLGWSTWRLFAVVLAEVGLVGLAAGVLGGALALPLAALAGVDTSLARAALAVPAAVGLALLAGLVPAARAARADPAAAVRPDVLEAKRAWQPRGIGTLALVNLLRTPGRTALGALSLAIGVCALTLLLAATIAFKDVLVGTLLGDAVAVRVRSTDIIAVVATIALGVASVADVLFLNLRERAAELATLTATGWDDRALGRLVALEGLWIGGLGGIAGAAAGLAAAALFAGALPVGLLLTTLAAAIGGTLLAGAAALAPAMWLRRVPAVPLLAGE
jgi:putative ABC transport system permease protein